MRADTSICVRIQSISSCYYNIKHSSHCHEDKFKHTNKVSNIFTETTAICATETRCEAEVGTSGSGLDPVVGCCEHGTEPSFSVKCGQFLQQMRIYKLLKALLH